jgi:transglutaminase-like putative cysteine protease
MRTLARDLVEGLPSKAFRDEARALFHFVRDEIRYLGDVNEVETLQAPDVTLAQGQGDCDDKATLLASLLQAIGHPTQFVAVGFTEYGVFEHVYLRTLAGDRWIALDPSVTAADGECAPRYSGDPCPGEMGWEPHNTVSIMVENT